MVSVLAGVSLLVRPLAGAGIEIVCYRACRWAGGTVRPLAGAGIEIVFLLRVPPGRWVRPLAGAGIEISMGIPVLVYGKVRPLAGAGIEIHGINAPARRTPFAPSRGRELKSHSGGGHGAATVRPLAGAGIEIKAWKFPIVVIDVRPLAGAGIEIDRPSLRVGGTTFAPSRGRELK